jgi:hypothetical protein
MFLATNGILARGGGGGGVDPDAQAFITAAGITNPTQQGAINTLVVDLKGYSIWTKFKAIYPIVGGSASSHKFNLKDPRDLDAAFRLTFTNAWTHSATGMTPNGLSAYANTFFNPTTQSLAQNNSGIGVYNRNNTAFTGAHGQRASNNFELFTRWTDNKFYCYINDGGAGFNGTVTDSRGLFQGSRTALSAIRLNINTTQFTGTQASTGLSNANLWIGASNNGGAGIYFDNRELAFFYISEGFNNTEMQNIYIAVQAYQTTLSRQV